MKLPSHAPNEEEVIPLFVLDPFFFSRERAQALPHRMQYLLQALGALEQNLAACGTRLLIVPGRSVEVVPRLARDLRVDRVVGQRWVEPFARLTISSCTTLAQMSKNRFDVPFLGVIAMKP